MKNILKTYKSVIILLAAIIIGAILGMALKENAAVLKPFGDIFLNLLFVTIVPLVFLSITTSISRIKQPKRIGKIMITIIATFVVMSLISVLVGIVSTYSFKLVNTEDGAQIRASLEEDSGETSSTETDEKEPTILDRTVSALTVTDFSKLLSKDNILPLVVFSILFGVAIKMAGEKGEAIQKTLESAYEVTLKFVQLISYYSPIGLGCYFAVLVGTYGSAIAVGYAKTFVIYTLVSIVFYIVMYSVYAFIAGGKKGLITFWKNIITPTAVALATCSSAAAIPANTEAAKKIGVSDDIAETTVPLGTSFHKDGSIIGSVFKIMFLVCLFGTNASIFQVIGVALVANLLVTAVPIGGGTISEMMIISMMGYPVAALPILTMIATVIDAPATVLNSVGDSAASMLVARFVDGKDWMNKKETGK
jgi:Na+/H+-dicarboxylate symporter